MTNVPCVLIAAPLDIIRELGAALGRGVKVVGATTFEECLGRLGEEAPQLIVVCYIFDHLRPYRLIQHIRAEGEGKPVPILLVRALPVRLGNEEAEVRDSYLAMGVSQFLNLWSAAERHGRPAALQEFSDCALSLLPRVFRQDSA